LFAFVWLLLPVKKLAGFHTASSVLGWAEKSADLKTEVHASVPSMGWI